jgi:hypothetical protein
MSNANRARARKTGAAVNLLPMFACANFLVTTSSFHDAALHRKMQKKSLSTIVRSLIFETVKCFT